MKNRDTSVDIFKGIGILLMLMGHVGLWGKLSYWFHAFNMPMFFFISGYLYKEKEESLRSQVSNKLRSLLVPYFITGIVLFVCENLRSLIWGYSMPYRQGINLLWDNTSNVPIGGIWFLTALLWTNLLFILLKRIITNDAFRGLVCFLIGIVGMIAAGFLPFRLPWAIDAGMVGMIFYYIGYIVDRKKEGRFVSYVSNIPFWHLLIFFFLNVVLIFANDEVNMRTGEYSNGLLFLINALSGTLIALNVSKRLEKLMKNDTLVFKRSVSLIQKIGEHSLLYVCFNQLIITIFTDLLSNYFGWDAWSKPIHFGIKIVLISITIDILEIISKTDILNMLTLKGKRNENSR